MRSPLLTVALAAALVLPVAAHADGLIDEARVGVYEHDISLLGHQKEKGQDYGGEILFGSPDLLGIIGAPRPILGFLVNSAGQTDQLYTGVTWTWNFWKNLLREGDGLYVEGTLGAGLNDGKEDVSGPEANYRKSLGAPVLFREDIDFGYRFTPRWSLALSYNHISNADLAKRNEGLNNLGGRIGFKF